MNNKNNNFNNKIKNIKKEIKLKKLNYKNLFISFLGILTLIFIDYFFKNITYKKKIEIFEFFKIYSSLNKGSSFSLFSNIEIYNSIIIFLSIIVIFFLLYLLFKNNKNYSKQSKKNKIKDKIVLLNNLFLIFSISGISGNLLDRIIYEGVRDFLYIKNLFIFNIADIYLNLAILIAILLIKEK